MLQALAISLQSLSIVFLLRVGRGATGKTLHQFIALMRTTTNARLPGVNCLP